MRNEPKAGDGLDPEVLAAYLDKRLPPDERVAVEAKLATDPDSYELLVELIHANEALGDEASRDEDAKAPGERPEKQGAVVPLVPRPQRTRGWAIAGSVLAVAAAMVLVVRLQPDLLRFFQPNATEHRLAALIAAAGDARLVEGRLSGFRHAPMPNVTRGSGREATLNLALLQAAGEIQTAVRSEANAANLHAGGISQLLIGNRDDAIRALTLATERAPGPAAIWSDLAAAYLARGDANNAPSDYARALDAVTRAIVAQNPPSPEMRFNRALAAEKLGQADAHRFWLEALAAESDPSWKAEIADRARRRSSTQ